MPEAKRCALYRHFGVAGELLYVGITLTPGSRTRDHLKSAEWFESVAEIKLEWFEDRWAAAAAETRAISEENPRFNLFRPGTPYGSRRRPRPHRPAEAPVSRGQAYGLLLNPDQWPDN